MSGWAIVGPCKVFLETKYNSKFNKSILILTVVYPATSCLDMIYINYRYSANTTGFDATQELQEWSIIMKLSLQTCNFKSYLILTILNPSPLLSKKRANEIFEIVHLTMGQTLQKDNFTGLWFQDEITMLLQGFS